MVSKRAIRDGGPRNRRDVLKTVAATGLVLASGGCMPKGPAARTAERFAEIEAQSGGRLGVSVLDLRTGETAGHRETERFGLCSTFKLPLAAAILLESELGNLDLDDPVAYTADDMVPYAPVTGKNLDQGSMTVVELAEAAQKTSDNVAANLLLDLIGGPAGFTQRLRSIGDGVTRLDRYEPEMNFVPAGEVRDTTTPRAMAATVGRYLAGDVLTAEKVTLLRAWMEDTRTGLRRLRAGLPADWAAGDKTGTGIAPGMANKYNDVAAAWPGGDLPDFVVAAYYEADGEYDEIRRQDENVLERVGAIAASWITG